jgi:thioesterase domain-containing protein
VLLGTFTDLLSPQGEFGIHDDFFTAGGTSLTAMRLIVMIEKHFGTRLSLPAFVAAPTVAELASRLRSGAAAPAFDPLVPIRASGSRRPLFLVHPLGGNVLCYVRLARHLPGDQPLYALQAAGAAPGTTPVSSMEGLADSYLAAIRRVQPTGPYTIGGWSFGGFVAFEMARRLSRANGEIGQVLLLDSISPEPGRRPPEISHTPLLEWFFWELLWTEQGGSTPVEGLPTRLETDEDRLGFIAERAAAAGIVPAYDARPAVRRLFQVYKANWTALMNYRPGPADFDLTLLRATESLPRVLWPMHGMHTAHQDPENGWGAFTSGRVEVISVPGDHLVMLDEPNVQSVAQAVMDATGTRRHEVFHHAKEQADGC